MSNIKTWSFLLPDSGSHELRVENIGEAGQAVHIDGVRLEAPEGTMMFTGPGGSLVELRKVRTDWKAFINGLVVEGYDDVQRKPGDDTLRDLRSRPDGAYTIAPKLNADYSGLRVVRKFGFTCRGELHTVEVAHKDWVWHVVHNGAVLDRMSHSMSENKRERTFQVEAQGTVVPAEVHMEWNTRTRLWSYTFAANHIAVPACWTRANGDILGVHYPEVVGAAPLPSAPAQAVEEKPFVEEELPQGVSFDSVCKSYQANIRVNGRFVFLGEFCSAAEASARYEEEAAKLRAKGVSE